MPPISSPDRFEEIRAANPDLQLYVYAVAPGEVTLEIVTPDGQVYPFKGPTLADALETAFPSEADPALDPPEPSPMATDIFD